MKKAFKTIMPLFLVLGLAFSVLLTGCPGSSGGQMIGVTMPTQSLQRWNQDGSYLKEKLEAAGYQVDLQYANNNVATQVSQLENQITNGCKVLVIASIDGTALKGVLGKAGEAGIKVIAYDRLIKETPNVDYYATFDNYMVGKIQGDYIVDKLGLKDGKGPYNMECFGGSPDDNNAFVFNKGAMDQLQKYIDNGQLVVQSGQTDMKQIAIMAWKAETAQARMDNLLSAYYANKKVDVVLSPNDSLAQGIVASLKAAGYGTADKPFPVLTGQDCDIINVKQILAGEQSMSIFKDTRTLAERAQTMVKQIMSGQEVEVNDTSSYDNGLKIVPSYLCTPVFVDKDNYMKILIDSGYYTEAQLQ
jgi:putative multiple sugar transport system substrate-binding protein